MILREPITLTYVLITVLILAERARLRRGVRRLRKEEECAGVRESGYNEACDDILAALQQGGNR